MSFAKYPLLSLVKKNCCVSADEDRIVNDILENVVLSEIALVTVIAAMTLTVIPSTSYVKVDMSKSVSNGKLRKRERKESPPFVK